MTISDAGFVFMQIRLVFSLSYSHTHREGRIPWEKWKREEMRCDRANTPFVMDASAHAAADVVVLPPPGTCTK